MAILEKELDCFPADLLDLDPAANPLSGTWSAVHTRPRAEKALARRLRVAGVPFYLPQYERRYRQQRRLVKSQLPLFPGYLFIHADDDQRLTTWNATQTASVIDVADQAAFRADLLAIRELVESGAEIAPEDRLEPGSRAEIVGGPFKGREGVVLRRGSQLRLVVAVDFLQKGASVEVETSDIRWIP